MNQTIRQKQAVLQALRDRFALSTSEMYVMIGRKEPVKVPRFNVVPLGKNLFDVVERSTGVSRGASRLAFFAGRSASRRCWWSSPTKVRSNDRRTDGQPAGHGDRGPASPDGRFLRRRKQAEQIASGVSGDVGGPIKSTRSIKLKAARDKETPRLKELAEAGLSGIEAARETGTDSKRARLIAQENGFKFADSQ